MEFIENNRYPTQESQYIFSITNQEDKALWKDPSNADMRT